MKTASPQDGESHSCRDGIVGDIKEVTVLSQHDQFGGLLALYDVEYTTSSGGKHNVTLESWLAPLSHEELLNLNMSNGPQRLVGLEVTGKQAYNTLIISVRTGKKLSRVIAL